VWGVLAREAAAAARALCEEAIEQQLAAVRTLAHTDAAGRWTTKTVDALVATWAQAAIAAGVPCAFAHSHPIGIRLTH
jgi:hypothetical protein